MASEEKPGRGRLFAAYATIAVLTLIPLAVVLVLSSGSDLPPAATLTSTWTAGSPTASPPTIASESSPQTSKSRAFKAAQAAGCELRLRLPDEGSDHIPPTAPEPRYRTNPPTSGDHVEEQQADGAYRETPPAVSIVHSLEHGRMAIQYRPDLPRRAQLELIDLFDTMYGGTLLFPRPGMPYIVAAATWTNLLGCRSYDKATTLAAIEAFGRTTWGKYGGESVLGLRPADPTPESP